MYARGFTLIELLIACVILAILAAIALPSYQNQVHKSRRTDAKSALVGAAGQMERYFTERGTYATAAAGSGGVYPATNQNGYYALLLANLNDSTYTLRAQPEGVTVGY